MMIPILMFAFSLGGVLFGMAEETLVFVLLTVPLAVSLGFDTITGIAIPFVGSQAGCDPEPGGESPPGEAATMTTTPDVRMTASIAIAMRTGLGVRLAAYMQGRIGRARPAA